jgi:hypothetical protein
MKDEKKNNNSSNFSATALTLFIIGIVSIAFLIKDEIERKQYQQIEARKFIDDFERKEAIEADKRRKYSIKNEKKAVISNWPTPPSKPRPTVEAEPKLPSAFEQRHGYPEKALMDSIKRGLIKD